MKHTIIFSAYTNFGSGDSVDWELSYDVTQEQYNRLIEAFETGDSFCDCEDVADIYEEVYDAANEQATIDLKEYNYEQIEEYIDENDPDSWRADHVFTIGVDFPYEWDSIGENE